MKATLGVGAISTRNHALQIPRRFSLRGSVSSHRAAHFAPFFYGRCPSASFSGAILWQRASPSGICRMPPRFVSWMDSCQVQSRWHGQLCDAPLARRGAERTGRFHRRKPSGRRITDCSWRPFIGRSALPGWRVRSGPLTPRFRGPDSHRAAARPPSGPRLRVPLLGPLDRSG